MIRVVAFVLSLTLVKTLWAQDIPDFSANYLVKLNGIQAGELKRRLITNDDNTRQFSSTSSAKGMFAFFKPDVVEESSLFLTGATIQPLSYQYKRTGGKKDKFMNLDFDWPNLRVHIDDKKHPWTLSIEPNTLDKLVYQIALMRDLSTEKTEFNYLIADGGKVKNYHIQKLETEILSTPLGDVEAVKLTRLRDKKSERETILWCAPKLNFLPVKLEHTEKGGARFTALIRRLKGFDVKAAIIKSVPRTPSTPHFGKH
jgi:hypothetical protein